jgi:hypothetical protein
METSHRHLLKLLDSLPQLSLPSHPLVLVGNGVRPFEPSAHRLRPVAKKERGIAACAGVREGP